MDVLTPEQRHKNMSRIRSKNTKIEVTLRKALWHKGIRYRKNYNKLTGRPDIVLTQYKIAIFCDSEFWHGKNWEKQKQRLDTNKTYWITKIEKNIARDLLVSKTLKDEGWIVLRFWETEIKKEIDKCMKTILDIIKANFPANNL